MFWKTLRVLDNCTTIVRCHVWSRTAKSTVSDWLNLKLTPTPGLSLFPVDTTIVEGGQPLWTICEYTGTHDLTDIVFKWIDNDGSETTVDPANVEQNVKGAHIPYYR